MITREEFDKLDNQSQLEYINKLTMSGISLTNISKTLNISRKTLTNRFAKIGYAYDDNSKSYIYNSAKADKINSRSSKSTSNNSVPVKEYNENTDVFLNANMKEKFVWMMNNFDVLESIINERIQGEYKENTIVEVSNLGFVIDLPPLDNVKDRAYQTTIRLNKKVWEEFNELFNHQYSNLNKYDVISVCFQEFIAKYKNK